MTKRRAAPGTGSVFEDKHANRYIGQIAIDGIRHRVYGRTMTEARTKLNAIIRAGGTPPPETQRAAAPGRAVAGETVAGLVDVWVKRDLEGRTLAPSTLAIHRWAVDHIKADPIAERRAADLTVRHVDDMLDRLAAGGLSKASLHKVRSSLRQALQFAVVRGDLIRNVAAHASLPPSAPGPVVRKSLTPDQARTLLAALRNERNGLMFALSLRIGLRPGEAAALHWSDLHGNVLNITHGRQRDKGRVAITDELKTTSARRTIELPVELLDWFTDHRRAQAAVHLSPLMFTTPTGAVIDPAQSRRQLADICTVAGVPVIRPNELRHSCASLLSDIGVPNEQLADLLGHTTTRMVDQTYRHRLRRVVDVAARADWTQTS